MAKANGKKRAVIVTAKARKRKPTAPAPDVVVHAKCIFCKEKHVIRESEVPKGQHPVCKKCFGPLVAVKVVANG